MPRDATPASEFRAAGRYYIAGGSWWDPVDDEAGIDWVKRLDAVFGPHRLPGRYINFVSDDDVEAQRESLGGETYARLTEVKAKYDPDNALSRKRAAPVPAAV
jgi:hypothetical protein